jgi:hypothetical protein
VAGGSGRRAGMSLSPLPALPLIGLSESQPHSFYVLPAATTHHRKDAKIIISLFHEISLHYLPNKIDQLYQNKSITMVKSLHRSLEARLASIEGV